MITTTQTLKWEKWECFCYSIHTLYVSIIFLKTDHDKLKIYVL